VEGGSHETAAEPNEHDRVLKQLTTDVSFMEIERQMAYRPPPT
jgi:hypothetical protein